MLVLQKNCHAKFTSNNFDAQYVCTKFYSLLGGGLAVILTHCGRVTQICVFNTVKLGTSASSP